MNIVTFPYELYFAPASNLVAKLLAREVSSTKLTVALYERIGKLVTLCQKRAQIKRPSPTGGWEPGRHTAA
jgi:hypothetical protein